MKLKNLFLTSLVALALGACSSASEDVTNPTAGEKNAAIGFQIAFPTARAITTDAGAAYEQALNKVDVRVVYSKEGVAADTYSFVAADFDRENNVWTLKAAKKMAVSADAAAKVYVTLNGNKTATENTDFTAAGTVTAAYTNTLDQLEANGGIAQKTDATTGNFLMSGMNTANIVANKTDNTVTVNVDRVASKIEELSVSDNTLYTITNSVKGTTALVPSDKVTVSLVDYSFINLNTTSYIYAQTTGTYPTVAENYFQYVNYGTGSEADFPTAFKAVTKTTSSDVTANNGITYCMENASTATPTYVVYKAQIKFNNTNTGDCFTVKQADGTYNFYKDFTALDAANNHRYSTAFGLTKDSSHADFAKAGVTKYTDGFCYYVVKINDSSIIRNNWYKLTVNKINGIGGENIDPKDPSDPTLLSLTVEVKPWTVVLQGIDL